MPKRSKRRSYSQTVAARRWSNTNVSGSNDSVSDEYSMDIDDQELTLSERICLTDIGDLAEICKSNCSTKYISVSLYMSLRFLNITWREIDKYLKYIGVMSRETSHKWATIFIKGDYEAFSNDLRGGEQADSFYDTLPEIEADAKAYVVQACS